MKETILFALLIIMCGSGFSQKKTEEQVAQAVESLRQAILDGGSAKLDQLTDSELSYGHSAGKIENKKEFIEALASGQSDFETMDLSDQTIVVKGKTAVVRHKLAANIKDRGKAVSIKLAVLLVWVKQKKQWKLLARQGVKI